jgi:predicted transcriptional regulator
MSARPGRPPEKDKPHVKRAFKREQLSSDAKIIVALLKKQPLTNADLIKETMMKQRTFHRSINLLKEKDVIQCSDGMYALKGFDFLEKRIEDAFVKLLSQGPIVHYNHLVNELGKPWTDIQSASFKIAKKLDLFYDNNGSFIKKQ